MTPGGFGRSVNEGVHGSAQRVADQIHQGFWVQSAETVREYTWESGTRPIATSRACSSSVRRSWPHVVDRCVDPQSIRRARA
jgi:hypothetical protein